jgi:hypothetical protein
MTAATTDAFIQALRLRGFVDVAERPVGPSKTL